MAKEQRVMCAWVNAGSLFGVGLRSVGDFPIETNSCGSSLAAGANCTFTISFDPTASGARSAVLQIMTNAASSPDKIQLMGTGN